jgi:small-conductance mechanosensitive channel
MTAGRYDEELTMKKDYWLYGFAVVTGIVVWVFVSTVSGRREAWDSQWYVLIGIPVVCLVSAALGYVETSRPWRWGVAPLIGQFSWMLLTQGPGNLLPLGLVVFGVLSVPSIITAQIGAAFGSTRAK